MTVNNTNPLIPADFADTFGIITRGAADVEIRARNNERWFSVTYQNGYTASVVRHNGSYGHNDGLWEVAVCRGDRGVAYDTPITNDVIGYADNEQVQAVCKEIAALPKSA